MIAGRFHWKKPGYAARGKNDLIAFDFETGTMVLTETAKKKPAGVWIVKNLEEVDAHDPGGLDLSNATLREFRERLAQGRHTLKRALSDPEKFDGIGNAYGDEILHAPSCHLLNARTNSPKKRWSVFFTLRKRPSQIGSSD